MCCAHLWISIGDFCFSNSDDIKMKIYFMQKLSLKIFQVTIRLTTLFWKTEKLEIVSSFDNFVFVSLKLWGEKYRLVILLEEKSAGFKLWSKVVFKEKNSKSYKLVSLSNSFLVLHVVDTELFNWPWISAKFPEQL